MLRTAAALSALLAAASSAAQQPPALPPAATPMGPARQDPAAEQRPPVPPGAVKPTRSHPPKPIPRGAVLEEISGVLQAVDGHAHRITVGTAGGPVTLTVDRNTMVYTSAGLGTVADLVPGSQLRAGRNADALAYWVQIRRPTADAEPQSTPGQGTGPAGGSGPPAEGRGAGAAPPGGVGPGSVAPGAAPPASGAPGR